MRTPLSSVVIAAALNGDEDALSSIETVARASTLTDLGQLSIATHLNRSGTIPGRLLRATAVAIDAVASRHANWVADGQCRQWIMLARAAGNQQIGWGLDLVLEADNALIAALRAETLDAIDLALTRR